MSASKPPISSEVGKTVLLLIQAFLKTGYYQPGHPETDKAREGLYEAVTAMFYSHPEITFLANIEEEKEEVLVGGVAHDYLSMRRVMVRNMADLFLPKMIDFFRRKRLSSFSLRHGITRYEFDTFIDLMTQSGWLEDSRVDVCERMSKALVAKEIVNVSVVFLDDLVGHGRQLPWRVVATLSRLKRDLNMVPLYRHVDAKEISRVRQQVFQEIVAPLSDVMLIRDLLINIDLIVETLHDFDRDTLVLTILDHLSPVFLPAVCTLVVKELADLMGAYEESSDDTTLRDRVENVRWVTRRLGETMIEGETADASLFHALVKYKVYLYEEIPPELREKISALQAVSRLLESPQKYFTEIEQLQSPKMLESRLWHLLEMLPELIRQCHDKVAREVVAFAGRYGSTFDVSHRPPLVDRLHRCVTLRAQEEGREGVAEMLVTIATLDRTGLQILVFLADNDNRSLRRLGLEALAERGQAAVPVLFEALKEKQGWHFLRNMLVLLSRIGAGGPKVEKLFQRCLVHPQSHVRIEAVQALAKLSGSAGEGAVAELLDDKEADVRQRAVGALAVTGISLPATIGRLEVLLQGGKSDGEAMALQVVSTLNKLKPTPFAEPGIEDALLELARPKRRFGFGGKESALSSHLREGALQSLGYLGTEKCKGVLQKCNKESGKVASIAKDALARVESRSS
jgi:hypothetical protein